MTNSTNNPANASGLLLPCPFCGCSTAPELKGNGIGDNWLECVECCASTRLREDGAGSAKDWNRRAAASVQAPGQAVAWQVRRADGRIDGAPIQWENCTKELYDATLETGRYAGYENGPRCEVRALTVAAPSSATREAGNGVTKPTLSEDVLMQAIADTAARGHVWASRALSNFRAAVREAATSPNDA
ncbi:Lar family restriction alleviation protein (plasmid) [Paraburkholderia strydomiana]